MPEEVKKLDAVTEDVLAKIERLESLLKETEKARKQGIMVARISMLVILVAVLGFAWNLWGFYKSFTSDENMQKFQEQVWVDLKDVMDGPEMKAIQNKIYKDSIPKISNIFVERFKREIPTFQEKGKLLLENLKDDVARHLTEELTKTLDESLQDVELELLRKFPSLTPEKLEQTLAAAQYVFVEDITDELEERLVDLSTVFDDLDKIISKYRTLDDYKALENKEVEDIKLELVESILELAIYEVNPSRGEQKHEGGSK